MLHVLWYTGMWGLGFRGLGPFRVPFRVALRVGFRVWVVAATNILRGLIQRAAILGCCAQGSEMLLSTPSFVGSPFE